ncbi:helicase conserved C-terminal domain protein [Mycobacterium avium subsp. avium 2285 (R)]|nr:helicase conserved C-terminal domain protein [Mycobacterium avium subsp. avium 2285 (R)]
MALWEPALRADLVGENGAPVRRSAGGEAARVMADLIAEGAQTLTFVRSRRAAELTALGAQARLDEIAPELSAQVASYRAGYLAEDRTALERALAEGRLRGLATTNALELGVDIAGLDAVVLAGFPGTVASFWQQAGRSGRRGQGALVVLIARDDPLDTYLVHNPAALLGKPVERVVIDPRNPYILGPQLLCAATELPLQEAEVRELDATEVAEGLVDDGLLRRRNGKYFPAPGLQPHAAVDIRGAGGQVVILEADTGRLLGSAGAGQAPASVHPGAVYLHQGESYVVDSLDLQEGIAFVHAEDPGYATFAREITDIAVTGAGERLVFGPVTLGLVPVRVTHRVVGYLRRRLSGEVIDFIELDMPEHTLATTAAMYTITEEALRDNGIDGPRIPGRCTRPSTRRSGCCRWWPAATAATSAACPPRRDPNPPACPASSSTTVTPVGRIRRAGLSPGQHLAGGDGRRHRGVRVPRGCPSCVQSPKCGNGNDPLDKAGAARVLRLVLAELDGGPR